MNRSLNNKKIQHTAAGAKRPVSLLSSEEELSDRRSSSSIESTQSLKDSKCQRSTRKAAQKGWQEKFDPFECHFVGLSSTSDEEWSDMVPKHSRDSDLDWSPEESQSRSTAPQKHRPIAMKRTSPSSAPILKSGANLKDSDEDLHSSPPKLMAIVKKSKDCPKPSRPPQLKAKPTSPIDSKDKILLSVQTPLDCVESTSSPENPPTLAAKPIFETIKEKNLSVANCKPPKLKVKPTQIQKDCNNQLKPKEPPSNVVMEPESPNSRKKVKVSVTSPKLLPIFEKPKEKSQVECFASPPKETTFFLLAEDDVSEASLEPPKLSIVKTRRRSSHKSSKPPMLEELVSDSGVIEEDQASSPSPGPPNLTSTLTKSNTCNQKSSQSPRLKAATSNLVVPDKDKQISVIPSPAALNLVTSDTKSKKRSHKKSSRPPVLKETTLISKVSEVPESIQSPLTSLKSKSVSNKKGKRKSSKSSQPSTLEDLATISPTSVLPEAQASSTPLAIPSKMKTIAKKKMSSSNPSPLPTVIPESTSDGVQRSTTSSPQLIIDFPLSFSGTRSHKASLLEKGFESGKFIILKSDLKTQKSPSIWRIDGKNLLQKYESISYNDGIAYRNISTYSSWMASNKGLYVPIEVEFSVQSKSETIVTFDRKNVMLPIEDAMMEALNEEANSMIDTFQIYLQTLISQALDSNFVKEIVKEQDEYFLSSIAAIEDHWILPKRKMLKEIIKMKKPFQELIEAHPGLELRCVTSGDKSCDSCNGRNPTRSFEFQTLSYSFDTLDIMEGKPTNKMYRLCLSCTDRILLYHELFHMRYHLFTCCQTKVNQYDQGDGPAALTSSLADQNWKSLMHRKVLLVLAETQQVISQYSADACVV